MTSRKGKCADYDHLTNPTLPFDEGTHFAFQQRCKYEFHHEYFFGRTMYYYLGRTSLK